MYKSLAAGWINKDKNGKTYLSVVLEQDFKKGDKLFLRKNEFKQEGEQSPDYRYSVKVEDKVEESEPVDSEEVANEVPF